MGYFKTLGNVLSRPADFKIPSGYGPAYLFALITQCFGAGIIVLALSIAGFFESTQAGLLTLVFGLIGIPIGAFLALVIESALVHILVRIFDGTGDFQNTFEALAYATGPKVFTFIPFLGFAASIWSIVVATFFVRDTHDLTTFQAVVAVLIPLFLLIAVFITAIALFVVTMREAFIL